MRKKKRIFRPKRRYKIRRYNANTVKIIAGAAALAALVFVGYSAAGPISRYLEERASQTETEPWTPEETEQSDTNPVLPEVLEPTQTQMQSVTEIPTETEQPVVTTTLPTETIAVITLPPETQPPVTTTAPVIEPPSYLGEYVTTAFTMAQSYETQATVQTEAYITSSAAVQTDIQTESETQIHRLPADIKSGGAAYSLSDGDMRDEQSLRYALSELAESGCSAVILPMRTQGGFFSYSTKIDFVKTVYEGEDPVRSELTAEEIVKITESCGLRPVALISTLNDNNRYGDYRDGSYRTVDDDAWLDASPDKGGKPWLSPFDDVTQDYLCDIVTELAEAGFGEIICDDFIFPEFRSSDIELLGEEVAPYSDRYHALTSLACKMTQAGNNAGARVMLRITANSVIRGYSELFYPEELDGCRIMIDYSENNISRTMVAGNMEIILSDMDMYEKVTAVYGEVSDRCSGLDTIPMIERASMSADEFSDAVKALIAMGYEEYYVY